ncbi:LOW QUALITY PROTEIN: hypothetical protein MAR_024477, partial [Mya arenaria]
MDAMENRPVNGIDNDGVGGAETEYRHRGLEDPDVCITVSGIDGEELISKANDLIKALGNDVHSRVRVTDATRLSFRDVDEKVLVLRNKYVLKDIVQYKQVFIKSSKSDTERLIELNARTILPFRKETTSGWTRTAASAHVITTATRTTPIHRISNRNPPAPPCSLRWHTLTCVDEHIATVLYNIIGINGYNWYGFSRADIHINAPKASGCVGVLVKSNFFSQIDRCRFCCICMEILVMLNRVMPINFHKYIVLVIVM